MGCRALAEKENFGFASLLQASTFGTLVLEVWARELMVGLWGVGLIEVGVVRLCCYRKLGRCGIRSYVRVPISVRLFPQRQGAAS